MQAALDWSVAVYDVQVFGRKAVQFQQEGNDSHNFFLSGGYSDCYRFSINIPKEYQTQKPGTKYVSIFLRNSQKPRHP